MDFSHVALSDEDQDFLEEVRGFLTTHITDEVIKHDRETGDNFHEGVHLALGAAGYLEAEWKPESDGASPEFAGGSGSWRSDGFMSRG